MNAPAPRFIRAMPESDYDAAVLADAPLAYWRFNKIEDGAVPNLAGDGYHARWRGDRAPSFARYTDTRVLDLTGRQSYLTAHPLASALAGRAAVTVEAIVRAEPTHNATILAVGSRREPNPGSTLLIDLGYPSGADSLLRFHLRAPAKHDPQAGYKVRPSYAEAAGRWAHILAVKTSDRMLVYLNGQRVAQTAMPKPLAQHVEDLLIGATYTRQAETPSRYFNGQIASLAVYPRALNEPQRRRHARQARQMIDTRFDESVNRSSDERR